MARNQALVAAAFAAIACSSGAFATSEALGGYLKDERAVGVSPTAFRIEPRLLHLNKSLIALGANRGAASSRPLHDLSGMTGSVVVDP